MVMVMSVAESQTIVRAVHRFLSGPPTEVSLGGLHTSETPVELPEAPMLTGADLAEALMTRRSGYRFADAAPTAQEVSALLRWSLGNQRTARLPGGDETTMCMAPSAGGLASLACYLSVAPGAEIPAGIYCWDRDRHALSGRWAGDPSTAWRSVLTQVEFVERAPMMLAIAGRLDTTLVKYPVRHYRTLHIDAGIALQNLYLVATALGLSGCAVTGFNDAALSDLLRLGESSFGVVVFPFGRQPARLAGH